VKATPSFFFKNAKNNNMKNFNYNQAVFVVSMGILMECRISSVTRTETTSDATKGQKQDRTSYEATEIKSGKKFQILDSTKCFESREEYVIDLAKSLGVELPAQKPAKQYDAKVETTKID
jgi:hypothetical protein